MSETVQTEAKAPSNPTGCTGCRHPVSLHGRDIGRCRAVGCTCEQYLQPAAAPE